MKKIVYSLIVFMLATAAVQAADDKGELRKRFQARNGQIQQLKAAGKVGETFDGYLEAVKPQFRDETDQIVSNENEDRRKLYKIIADEEGTTPAEVAKADAVRRFNKAKPGEYL